VFVGIDVHKHSHAAALVDERGGELGVLTFANSPDGYRRLIGWLADRDAAGAVIGVESPGSSASRPTNGDSTPATRRAPRAPATTRSARWARTGCSRPLTWCVPASSYAIAASLARRVVHQHRARRGDRLEPAGGIDRVAQDHALALGPALDRGRAGQHADAQAQLGLPDLPAERGDGLRERERGADGARSASSSRATGVPQTAIPHRR
jgi:hypothetical protein